MPIVRRLLVPIPNALYMTNRHSGEKNWTTYTRHTFRYYLHNTVADDLVKIKKPNTKLAVASHQHVTE